MPCRGNENPVRSFILSGAPFPSGAPYRFADRQVWTPPDMMGPAGLRARAHPIYLRPDLRAHRVAERLCRLYRPHHFLYIREFARGIARNLTMLLSARRNFIGKFDVTVSGHALHKARIRRRLGVLVVPAIDILYRLRQHVGVSVDVVKR